MRGGALIDPGIRAAASRLVAEPDQNERVVVIARMLASDDWTSAVKQLSDLTEEKPNDAAAWSDLSAVRHALGLYRADPHDFALALAAADHALAIDATMPEAVFNRGMALQSLGLHESAARAFGKALSLEPESEWAEETRQRLRETSVALKPAVDALAFAKAARAGRHEEAKSIARSDPQLTRQSIETETLGLWGKEYAAGHLAEAGAELDIARVAATELMNAGGDPMLQELVSAIDTASPVVRRELADAHERYREGRIAVRDRKLVDALGHLRASAKTFELVGSPMAYMARCSEAGLLNDMHESQEALAAIVQQQALIPDRYRAARAHLYWQEGTVRGTLGMVVESRAAYRRAVELFDSLHESVNAATVRQMAATGDFLLGYSSAAWTSLAATFRELSTRNREELQRALTGAARGEIAEEHWDVARSMIDVAVELELLGISPRREAYLWTQRAAASLRSSAGDASGDMKRAEAAAKLITAREVRDAALFDIRAMEAELAMRSDPARADAQLTANIEWAAAHDYRLRLPQQHIARSRARLEMNDVTNAKADLEAALDMIESRSINLDAHSRAAMLRALDDVMDEVVTTLVAQHQTVAAFELLERANDAVAASPPLPSGTVQAALQRLPADHRIVHYRSLPHALLIFVADRNGITVEGIDTKPHEVARVISAWRSAIVAGDATKIRADGEAAHALLIAPVASRISPHGTLTIIPDGEIGRVPFAALLDRSSKRFLIENSEIVYSRSTRRYVAALEAESRDIAPSSAVVIGDPALDQTQVDLPRLPASATESAEVARIYGSKAITGADATTRKLLEHLPKATIFHFAGHAILDPTDGRHSALLLAPEGSSTGVLYLRDVEASQLANLRVAVLAACTTAAPTSRRRALSLATAFLSAGVRSAVGTAWDVDDGATRQFSLRLHEQLARDVSAAAAVRETQLQLLGPDLKQWAAFQLWKG